MLELSMCFTACFSSSVPLGSSANAACLDMSKERRMKPHFSPTSDRYIRNLSAPANPCCPRSNRRITLGHVLQIYELHKSSTRNRKRSQKPVEALWARLPLVRQKEPLCAIFGYCHPRGVWLWLDIDQIRR